MGMKQARLEAAQRQRRIIFNDDTSELSRANANTAESILKHRLEPLAGTHVGTISWSILGGWGDAPVYDSKIQPIFGTAHAGPPPSWSNVTGNVQALIDSGQCPLQIVVDHAHANGMEAFASVRMNDVHDSFIPGGITTWKSENPRLLVDTSNMVPAFELYTTAQDFSCEEVRQRKLEIIQEVSNQYDIDGFELDTIRHPVFFSRTIRGEPATEDETAIMTALMHRVREITDRAATDRGKPLLIAVRVPDSFEKAKRIGLDVRTWLTDDLIDILIVGGGYAPFTLAVNEFISTAHEYGVPVYPCINTGWVIGVTNGAFAKGVRALAANWYGTGADGVYLWNLGTPFWDKDGDELVAIRKKFYACLNELGDPKALEGKDKLFCIDTTLEKSFPHYAHVSANAPLPLTSRGGKFRSGVFHRIPLIVGDDVNAAMKGGTLKGAQLVISFDDPGWKELLHVKMNGTILTPDEFSTFGDDMTLCQFNYTVDALCLRKGRNIIEFSGEGHKPVPDNPVRISSITLKVEYQSSERQHAPAAPFLRDH